MFLIEEHVFVDSDKSVEFPGDMQLWQSSIIGDHLNRVSVTDILWKRNIGLLMA